MTSVRMGEIAVSSRGGEELVALGLGSCIGLALVDRASGVAGLAHVVLPESRDNATEPGKFADLAVPELIARMRRAGAGERLEAVLTGGARMFELGSELDIGARNEAAVRHALAQARISVTAAATGGNRGRTVKVLPDDGSVSVREAGGETVTLLGGRRATPGARAARPSTVGAR
jgi:chemotaxis protein CheD